MAKKSPVKVEVIEDESPPKSKDSAPLGVRPPARSTAPKRRQKISPKRVLKVAANLHMSPGIVEAVINDYLNGER